MSALEELVRQKTPLWELEVEELAGYILEHLNELSERELDSLHLKGFSLGIAMKVLPDDRPSHAPIMKVLAEAWTWLQAQGLLTQHPDRDTGFFLVSRRGRKLPTRQDVTSFRKAGVLARERLHSDISAAAWSPFVRGEYETAVFASFKEVEVAVRKAGGYPDTDLGVPLMRKAFGPTGPLTDQTLVTAEQEAMSNLFAGSIGLFKNPSSHRHVALSDPAEAAELIGFASYLRRLVK